jgi:hypothetical protein
MQEIRETSRRPSPFPKPQSVAFDGSSLWIGSVATSKIYRLNPETLAIGLEASAPGKPWGMTAMRDELRVICGETEDDNRFVRRFVPGKGFTRDGDFQCPEDTGSQLSFDGTRLVVSQWYKRQLVAVDDKGNVQETVSIPHQICGQTFAQGAFYLLTTEDEATNDYWVTRVTKNGSYKSEDVAHVSFPARALAFDGKQFWTNHREADQIVSFSLP